MCPADFLRGTFVKESSNDSDNAFHDQRITVSTDVNNSVFTGKNDPQTGCISEHSRYPVEAIREQVLNGHLDLGYTVLYDMEQLQTEELDYCVINVCPHNVGMLLGNPLAKKELIEIQDLEKCKFVSISPLYTPSYNGMIDDLCHEAGFEPDMWF